MTREEREQAIADMRKLKAEYMNGRKLDAITERKCKSFDMAIEALKQNESAEEWYKLFVEKLEQEPTEWIPISERLPEEYKRVLVSDTWSGVYVGQYIDTEENWGGKHFINEGGIHSKTVIAWMPLPEPYKEG